MNGTKNSHYVYIIIFILAALLLNLLFFIYGPHNIYHAITVAHGNIGYNFYQNNLIGINSALADYVHEHHQEHTSFDYNSVRNNNFGMTAAPFLINDTIGYGILLGLLWKITNSLKLSDVQILQIVLYCATIPLIYTTAYLFIPSIIYAVATTLSFLAFLPLIALNVQAVRDIWAYFGLIVALFSLLLVIKQKRSYTYAILGYSWFALCQWLRPTLFLAIITLSIALLIMGIMRSVAWQKALLLIIILCSTNAIVFWLPFIAYNNYNYDRLFVGPVGQDLLEGLGEFNNPWGFKLSDEFVAQFIGNKYNLRYGSPEFDDAARTEFIQAYAQFPHIYWINMIRRIPMLIMPALPWLFYATSPYGEKKTSLEKIKLVLCTPALWLDFLLRHIYMYLYLLIGYIGIFLALIQRRLDLLLLIGFGIICAGWGKLPSHIEYRYLVPFYWAFCFFVGYTLFFYYKKYAQTQ